MKRAWLSDPGALLAASAATGLGALGWTLAARAEDADLLVLFEAEPSAPRVGECAVFVIPCSGRAALRGFSLAVQAAAIAAAPARRVNGIVVEAGWEQQLGSTLDWLAGADMVTGQAVLLSGREAPAIPL